MAQLSIFDKQRHFSNKDMTISVGKGDYIYITFRHDSWKRFTDLNRITVSVNNNTLSFGTPRTDQGVSFKLKMTHGNPETFEHTRYIQISGKAWPAILEAARNMAGSYDFPKQPTLKDLFNGANAEELINDYMAKMQHVFNVADPTPEQKPEPVEESAPISEEVKIPKGFIVFHDLSNDFFMISVSSIFFVEDYGDGRANVFWSGPDGNEHLSTVNDSFAEVLNLISKALEV